MTCICLCACVSVYILCYRNTWQLNMLGACSAGQDYGMCLDRNRDHFRIWKAWLTNQLSIQQVYLLSGNIFHILHIMFWSNFVRLSRLCFYSNFFCRSINDLVRCCSEIFLLRLSSKKKIITFLHGIFLPRTHFFYFVFQKNKFVYGILSRKQNLNLFSLNSFFK